MNADRRDRLVTALARELFRYDQGFVYEIDDPDPDVHLEYTMKREYVSQVMVPLIEPHIRTGRIVHGDDIECSLCGGEHDTESHCD